MTVIQIKTDEQAIEFVKKNIDRSGVLINADNNASGSKRRTVIKLIESSDYEYCTIDDLSQTPFQKITLEEAAALIFDLRYFVNFGKCYSIGNGRTPLYLTANE